MAKKKKEVVKNLVRRCEAGNCRYNLQVNGEKVISPNNFSCPYSFFNPQYPVYVSCKKLKMNEGDASLCQPFRDERRKIVRQNHIPMRRYIEILKQRTTSAQI